jgi:DNA-binding GntR family transcriptional regulator
MEEGFFNLKSLREQVYEYLKIQLNEGKLEHGAFLNLNAISAEMGISKTPLRDALFQLEAEGFVTIYPRRGVKVNTLTLEKIRNIYQILGGLEGAVLVEVAAKFRKKDVDAMRQFNEEMKNALQQNDFERFYSRNLDFHNAYLELSENTDLLRTVRILKERLYEFPRSKGFLKEWEVESTGEHDRIIDLLAKGDFKGAAEYIRDVHWSFAVQERYIRKYYFGLAAQTAER